MAPSMVSRSIALLISPMALSYGVVGSQERVLVNSNENRQPADAIVYCDGACRGNPGPGGYGVLVRMAGRADQALSGGNAWTTNNQMELTAAAVGLKAALALGATEIRVQSDSEYLVKGMKQWLRSWERNGWKTSTGSPVKNQALWEELARLSRQAAVSFAWIRGHVGHPENEQCDALAVAARDEAARGARTARAR
jgi:ribonuclease HI